MLTRQGWIVAAGAAALLAAGRALGLVELFALGATAMALLAGCAAFVSLSRLELHVRRSVHPTRLHVGSASRVELGLRNARRRPTPVLRVVDPVEGERPAELAVPPLDPGEATVAAYRLPTGRRGILRIGPLQVCLSDPFGLARARSEAAPMTEVIVYPQVHPIAPLPYTAGRDPQAGARRLNSLGRTGEEFYALRPYVLGDDLRRVHWASTARHGGDLLVRHNELPWQGRTAVVLDNSARVHSPASFELAVSAAASVVMAAARREDLVRLLTSAGADSDYRTGSAHVEAIMERLALVRASGGASLRRIVELLGRRSNGGALVVVLGAAAGDDLRAIGALRARFGSLTCVIIDRSAWDPGAPVGEPPTQAAPAGLVHVTRDASFPEAWSAQLARRHGQRMRAGGPR